MALAAVMMLVGLIAAPASAASVTITARPDDTIAECDTPLHITGIVTPHTATPKVVLQKTYGGIWRDYKGYSSPISPYKILYGHVNATTGAYTITMDVVDHGTIHLRVRSNGGSVVSKSFYEPIECGPTA